MNSQHLKSSNTARPELAALKVLVGGIEGPRGCLRTIAGVDPHLVSGTGLQDAQVVTAVPEIAVSKRSRALVGDDFAALLVHLQESAVDLRLQVAAIAEVADVDRSGIGSDQDVGNVPLDLRPCGDQGAQPNLPVAVLAFCRLRCQDDRRHGSAFWIPSTDKP